MGWNRSVIIIFDLGRWDGLRELLLRIEIGSVFFFFLVFG